MTDESTNLAQTPKGNRFETSIFSPRSAVAAPHAVSTTWSPRRTSPWASMDTEIARYSKFVSQRASTTHLPLFCLAQVQSTQRVRPRVPEEASATCVIQINLNLLTCSNHNSLKRKLLPREHTRPAPAFERFLRRGDRALKLFFSRLWHTGEQCLRARIMYVIPFIGLAFLKTTPNEIHGLPTGTVRSLPMGRDTLCTRTCERGETATIESKTRTTSSEHCRGRRDGGDQVRPHRENKARNWKTDSMPEVDRFALADWQREGTSQCKM
jgi:hypothetical protein